MKGLKDNHIDACFTKLNVYCLFLFFFFLPANEMSGKVKPHQSCLSTVYDTVQKQEECGPDNKMT